MRRRFLLALIALPWGGCSDRSEPAIIVSAASSLTYALQELADDFHRLHPDAPVLRLNYGATGALAQQIRQGAPVDLFAAANVAELDSLRAQGHVLAQRLRFYGRLVIWCRDEGPCPQNLHELERPEIRHIAIAHPRIAPYGAAAVAAIEAAGLTAQLTPRLIQGQSARTALRYAETGDADIALTALALARSVGGRWNAIDDTLYAPIEQGLALVSRTSPSSAARRFFEYVASPRGRRILETHGFRTEP